MAEAVKKKESKLGNWWKGLKAEFSKIIWPNKTSIVKQTFVVVIVTIIVGALISLIDLLIQSGLLKIISE